MPKKNVTIPVTELRPRDVVILTGITLPKKPDMRFAFNINDSLQTEPGVVVQRAYDERISVFRALSQQEAWRLPQAIEQATQEYLDYNGDPARMKLTTTAKEYALSIDIHIEGWTKP